MVETVRFIIVIIGFDQMHLYTIIIESYKPSKLPQQYMFCLEKRTIYEENYKSFTLKHSTIMTRVKDHILRSSIPHRPIGCLSLHSVNAWCMLWTPVPES